MAQNSFYDWSQATREQFPDMAGEDLASYYRENHGAITEDDYARWAADSRKAVPDVSDEELRSYYTQTYGEPDPVPGDAATALKDAWSEAKGIGGGVVGLVGQTLGLDGVRDWGMKTYDANMADVASRQRPQYGIDYLTEQGTVGDWVDAAQYHVTKGIPSLLSGLGAGLVGKAALQQGVKAAVKGASEKAIERAGQAGFLSGVGGYSVGQELGQIYPEAVREQVRRGGTSDDVNLPKVYGYGALSGAVETVGDVAMLGLGRLLPNGMASKLVGFTQRGSIPARVGKIAGTGMAIEGTEEAVQTPLEWLGADRQLGTPEFWAEERQSVFAGALGGLGAATVTAPMSIASTRQTNLLNPEPPADPTASQEPTTPAAPIAPPGPTSPAPSALADLTVRSVPGEQSALSPAQEAALNREPVAAPAAPAKPPTKAEAKRNALLQDSLDILDHLSAAGRAVALAGNQDTVVAPVRKLYNELRKLDVSTPEGRAQAQDFFDTYGRKVANRKTDPKSAAATDELVASFRFDLGMAPEEPLTPVVQAGTQTDVLNPEVPSAQRTEIAPPAPRPGDPAGETPAPVTAQADPGTEQAAPLATPPALTDVVGAVRTALTDAKGITPDQRETLDLWLNTPDGSDATFADIGEQLGITKQAAHKRVQTALSTLRSHPAVKAFAPQVRGLLSQTRAPSITENAAPTADNLAALASQNGVDQLDQRSIATTGGQLVDTADLAEGGNLTPSTTKTQIGLTDQQTDITGGSTDEALTRSAREMSAKARDEWGKNDALRAGLSAPGRALVEEHVLPPPVEDAEDIPDEPGRLAYNQRISAGIDMVPWDDVPPVLQAALGDLVSRGIDRNVLNDTFKQVSDGVRRGKQTPTRNAAPTQRSLGRGQADPGTERVGSAPSVGSRSAQTDLEPGNKNAALTRGTEPGTNDYQPAQSADEVVAALGSSDQKFRNWAGSRPIIDDATQYRGGPAVLRVYHATRATENDGAALRTLDPDANATRWDEGRALARMAGTHLALDPDVTQAFTVSGYARERAAGKPGIAAEYDSRGNFVRGLGRNDRPAFNNERGVAKEGGNVLPVYARIDNAVDVTADPRFKSTGDDSAVAKLIVSTVAEAGGPIADEVNAIWGGTDSLNSELLGLPEKKRRAIVARFWEVLRARGYNAVIYNNVSPRETNVNKGGKHTPVADVRALIVPPGADLKSVFNTGAWGDNNSLSFGEAPATRPTTRQAFEQTIQDLLGRTSNWRITVHDTAEQALAAGVPAENLRGTSGRGAYGWVETKGGKTHATFILERVQAGQELSAFMHEVGVHMGLENILDQAQIDRLFWKIVEWGDAGRAGNQSQEAQVAMRAMARIARAETPDLQIKSEAMAYFVEEAVRAGVNPTAMSHKSELSRWFRTLWAAFKTSLRKLGFRNIDSLTAQHVVDLAYGAARLELAGQWHGTGATFRRFDNSFANTGEGTQIEGSGIYLTPDQTRAREYAVGSALNNPDGEVNVMRADTSVTPDRLLHWDKPLSDQPVPVREAILSSGLVSDATKRGRDIYTSLASMLGSPRTASDFLNELGVQGTFRPQDGGDHVVIFDDKNVFRVGRAPGGDLSQIRYGEPSWAPPAQIQKAIDKLPEPLQEPVAHVVDAVRTAANKTHLGLAFTKDLADWIRAKAPPFKDAVDRYMTNVQAAKVERITRDKVVSDILSRYHALKLDAIQKPVAKFLADARVKGKWGYDPRQVTRANPVAWSPPGYDANEAVEVDPAMAEAFGKLTPDAQSVVVAVNKLLAENFQTTQELITQNINRVYDKRLAQLNERLAAETDSKQVAKTTKSIAKAKADQKQALKAFDKKLIKTKGPYAPLKRQGNYVVQAFSPELKALYDKGEARTIEETKRYNELRRDEKHYTLEFVANRSEARKRMSALSEAFGENVDAWEKTSWRDNTYVGLPEIDRLRSLVTEGVGEPGNANLVRDVENLALQIMADTHARQSQHHAKLTPGYDPDMIRAFVSQARADAHHISNLMYLDKINDAIQAMTRMVEDPKVRAQTKVDRDTLGRMVSELHRRWGDTLKHEPSPLVDRLAAVSSTWHLLLSPAYYFQNATQVGMMSVPWMAGTHGWATAQRAVLKAYQDILPMVKDKAASWEHFDTTKVPEDVRHVIASLEASGQINIFMDMELGQAATTSNTPLGKAGRTFDQTIRRLPAKLETINRVVTAIAAYRLARAPGPKQMSVTKATEYAGKVIDITHGDYDGFNAPRWISPGVWGPSAKLLFQFRKFQLIQLAFYARMFNDMTASHPPEVRKAAGKALAFSLAHTTAAAGALGFPALGLIQVIASLFGDDDEPNDKDVQDYKLRKAMQDGGMPDDMVDLVLGGLPALLNIDMTGKLGAQHLLTPLPYTQLDPQKQGNFEALATAAGGPALALVGKLYRGVGDLQRGEYLSGFEKILGPGLGDLVQAARLATKGEQTYNTDQAFSPEELGAATAIVAGLGFTPEILSKRRSAQRVVKSYETTFDRRTAEIKRGYSEAMKNGSRKDERRWRQEWLDLQAAKRAAKVQPSSMAELRRAPMEQRKRERHTIGGVKWDRGNRGLVESVTGTRN